MALEFQGTRQYGKDVLRQPAAAIPSSRRRSRRRVSSARSLEVRTMATLSAPVRLVPRGFGRTARQDAWWVQPLVVFLALSTFVVYATWAAFQGDHYTYGAY